MAEDWRTPHCFFWSSCIHGAGNQAVTTSRLLQMRRTATKNLGLNAAGTNPMLRLSLSDSTTADPGFYHSQTVFWNFIRIAASRQSKKRLVLSLLCFLKSKSLAGTLRQLTCWLTTEDNHTGFCTMISLCFNNVFVKVGFNMSLPSPSTRR